MPELFSARTLPVATLCFFFSKALAVTPHEPGQHSSPVTSALQRSHVTLASALL